MTETLRMRFSALSRAIIASLALTSFAGAQPAAPGARVFRAGAATSNMTPMLGSGIVGNFDVPPATHVHDELHARCLVLDDGAPRLVFVVVDNVSINRELFDEAKRRVHPATGIPVAHLMMSATHTHSATSTRDGNDYQGFLTRRIVDGVQRALNNLEPARIGWGSGHVPQHVFNRRWRLKDGMTVVNPFGGQDRAVMNPGTGRTDLAGPAGPTNSEVYILNVQSDGSRPIR